MAQSKIHTETQEKYHKIFIEQTPSAIAMLNTNMIYLAVSQRWLKDYSLEADNVIGKSHYEVFPEIGDDWKKNHIKCLQGAIDTCEEHPFQREDGTIQWIYWDVRPWYNERKEIGGLLMHTGDITQQKEKEFEKKRIEEILEKSNEIARIGTWELNYQTYEVFWSKIVREIYEVPDNFVPTIENTQHFYKEKSRNNLKLLIENALEHSSPFDLKIEITTAKGNSTWIRVVGQPEFVNGQCIRIFGIIQDIDRVTKSEQALVVAHSELEGIFTSKTIAIISTDKDGFLRRLNNGAEQLLGYSSEEIIGLKSTIFITEEEMKRFEREMANTYRTNNLSNQKINEAKEWTFRRKNGSTLKVLIAISVIENNRGENQGFVLVATDISKLKDVENELLKKNELLNFAEQITLLGHWQWNTVLDKVKWSENLYELVELDKNTLDLKFDTYFNFVHPDDKEMVKNYFDNAIANKKFYNFTHRIITTTGVEKTIQLLGKVIKNQFNEVVEIIGTGQDVTETKMAERKFKGLLESAPDAMVIVNKKGAVQLINRQAEKLFGYLPEELFEKSVKLLIPELFTIKSNQEDENFYGTSISKEMNEGVELYGIKKNSHKIPIQISLSPLYTEEGLLISIAIRDITKQKLAEQRIIESKEKLEVIAEQLSRQNKQLADFNHITSHNLRAPVANLTSLLQIYKNAACDKERDDIFGKFEMVIDHLSITLNTLIEALKTKISNSEEDLEYIDFESVLNNTKEILSGAILQSQAIIKGDFSKIRNLKYKRIYMESIFLNIIGNAIKYKSPDRPPRITVHTEIENGFVLLKFQDNGLGIDLDRHGHKLFGLNKVFHRHPDAKGVGLFLTKTQIVAMGGEIKANSKLNEGTVFTIKFK
ncbi:PAS domain S-box protein [Maribacter confluentis]|uniref:histidine kinase n=1 Tax=Maribacter confluentis TaxID=1656093 RepID=A0ABT8RQI9_9FLAO|nr:PAS domain S-box protein [Maribacter confluentis]MDO1513157.1 PAS domain S-box protein [Maribacter confluentis]